MDESSGGVRGCLGPRSLILLGDGYDRRMESGVKNFQSADFESKTGGLK